jgi:hypothetical protein
MTLVWKQTAQDLGFEFIVPFILSVGQETLTYLGVVPQFSRPKEMLVIVGLHADRHMRVAKQNGFGFSCFSENFEPYDRQSFIDILDDWGWSSSTNTAPSWYSGIPWTLQDLRTLKGVLLRSEVESATTPRH